MPLFLIWIVTVLYAGTSIAFLFKDNPGMAICFMGYMIGNFGLLISNSGGG